MIGLLASKAVFQCEELRPEIRQRLPQLRDLFSRTVNFETGEVGYRHEFTQQRRHVFDMSKNAIRILIAFAAVNLIAVKTETVVKTLRFVTRLLDKTLA